MVDVVPYPPERLRPVVYIPTFLVFLIFVTSQHEKPDSDRVDSNRSMRKWEINKTFLSHDSKL